MDPTPRPMLTTEQTKMEQQRNASHADLLASDDLGLIGRYINLSTPEGRALYRLWNVVAGQGVGVGVIAAISYLFNTVDVTSGEGMAGSLILGSIATALDKFRRDKKS